ncbi:SUKH-3 domain-containing protein [Streptomyces sp. NPDC018057]|uniref:SUKH-3 domain-containing protein n=1 Tax=unclassified Streptomyces TaxID=2593676 RepID=UPI0037B52A89
MTAIVLVDEHGRFFLLHHTGGYYMGKDECDAFSCVLSSEPYPDAEDFFGEAR